ncbi:hypothetical protein [Oceanobacillus sp. 1P07AA]|uniref:hypothetical protein n=1 Tax=Oceanobacillus sp. 1P07AA TaxID=3132293 RepID=UPI0039A44E9F
MKVVHMFSFLSLLLVMLTGCSNNESASLIKDHKFGLHAQGEFYRFNKAEQIGIYSTGPITIEFETAETIKGSMGTKVSYYDKEEYKDMELLGVHLKFEVNDEEVDLDKLNFSNDENIHLITDTGEVIDRPDQSLSSIIDIAILKNAQIQVADFEPQLRMFIFQLEKSTAEEIEEATLIIDAPVDSEGNTVGEALEIEIDFKE